MANRATRRNITISDSTIDDYLDTKVSNVSGFIQEALRFYIEEQDKQYATTEELEATKEELKKDIQILNKNFLSTKAVLDQVAKYMSGGSI